MRLLLLFMAAAIPVGIAVHTAVEQKNMEAAELRSAEEEEKVRRGQTTGERESGRDDRGSPHCRRK